MERSFAREVQSLKLGDGDVFRGEGILAITKALLQAGVSYVGGYQGAPVSHLMDVLADAQPILDDLGIHFEACANEAAAAAMCGASINYPMRGAAVWKSTVGTNVAADALSNLASAGVRGGVLILLGEDYGEGSSIIQERSHAFAMKSQMWLLDPRPHLPRVVELVEQAYDLSEASFTPVMMEFRIRACHMHGRFICKDNRRPAVSRNDLLSEPDFDSGRICLPPSTYAQERHKIEARLPAALDFIRRNRLNEFMTGVHRDVGIVMQGGLYNSVIRALQQFELATPDGNSAIPLAVLNVTYPLVPREIEKFCAGKKAVLVVEEGQPAYLEQAISAILRNGGIDTAISGKDHLPLAGEYVASALIEGIGGFLREAKLAGAELSAVSRRMTAAARHRQLVVKHLSAPVPKRPPTFCTGCPERPVFTAIKLVERELGKIHVACDIGCHTFSTLPPFNIGNSVLGYGLGLSSAAAVAPAMKRRVISIMGDGGFWHSGLTSGVSGAVFNEADSVLLIMDNGYTSATGQQFIPSTGKNFRQTPTGMTIRGALKGIGVRWIETATTYKVAKMVKTLRRALTTTQTGLKVIIAESECQLAVQRRLKPARRDALKKGRRVVDTRYGVDGDICTGDHACIRLSGCPSLTIAANPDPMRRHPVARVDPSCVGCGLCGEVAHAAVLCPSFYRAEVVRNPNLWDRTVARLRTRAIGYLQARAEQQP